MRTAARIVAAALAALAVPAAALNLSLSGSPTLLSQGQTFTLTLAVQNPSATDPASNVGASLASASSGLTLHPISVPSPGVQSIPAASTAYYVWTYSASGYGNASFSATVAGSVNGTPVSAGPSNALSVFVATPTPTPTATPVVSPTPTPWIIVGTATPVPLQGGAVIPGNLFHPDQGQPLQLIYDAPYEGRITVDIYDRLGRRVKHFERQALPGTYTELWDGRGDDGLLVATGIYAAQFSGKALQRTLKFAVIK